MGAAMTRVETWVDGQLVGVSDQPDAVPESITSVQMRLALLDAGLLDAISAYVEHQPEDVRTEWEYATEIRRDHQALNAGAQALGMTAEQVDSLFVAASRLGGVR